MNSHPWSVQSRRSLFHPWGELRRFRTVEQAAEYWRGLGGQKTKLMRIIAL